MLDDGEPQSGATLCPRTGLIDSEEPLEDTIQSLGWNPGAIVLDTHTDLAIAIERATHLNATIGAAIFDGIVHEIDDHLFEETWVRLNLDGIGNVDFQGDSFDTGGPLHVIHHPGNLLEKRHFMQIDRRLAALQFGDGEQISHKQCQSVRMLLHLAQEVHQGFLLHLGMIHDGFDKSLDHRQGCP